MSNLLQVLSEVTQRIADVTLPQDCLVCGALAGRRSVCDACAASLPRAACPACRVCALPLPAGGVCGRCLRMPPAFDASRAALAYAFPVDRLIQALKYGHRLAIARYFSGLLLDAGAPQSADCIVAVPMHGRALRERGFNQALELARPLSRHWGLPLMVHGVQRIVDGPPQASLSGVARRRNVRRAFAADSGLAGRSVLVIDDVMTTGATLDAFARSLKRAGVVRVENLVVARTDAPD